MRISDWSSDVCSSDLQNFESRKNVLMYDDVMDRQRHVIYYERREVLECADLKDQMLTFIDDVIEGYVNGATEGFAEEWDLEALWVALKQLYPITITLDEIEERAGGRAALSRTEMISELQADAPAASAERAAKPGEENDRKSAGWGKGG